MASQALGVIDASGNDSDGQLDARHGDHPDGPDDGRQADHGLGADLVGDLLAEDGEHAPHEDADEDQDVAEHVTAQLELGQRLEALDDQDAEQGEGDAEALAPG